ncbi:MAG: isoprenylcysteine carboxylmethyltransferase family protein [Boseongicola sp.]|nr:isoprenylcysteine carboxylmethyltransferase family protein [Boseongicola sp.]
MKQFDLPPVWTLVFAVLAWVQPFRLDLAMLKPLALVFWLAAAFLFLAASMEFLRSKTSIIPRQTPSAMINGGIFRISRNPIYLADVLILAGVTFWTGSIIGFGLVPVLVWVLTQRFIVGEEAALRETFAEEFDEYSKNVRRWL